MSVISFQFAQNTDRGHQDQILSQLKSLAGIRTVDRIDSTSEDDDILRMCFAESVDSSQVPTILAELHRLGAQGVSVETRRGLA
ncbi:MAG: hypothetical protein ACRC8S_20415 [Fimbriiglobus sp.]